MTPLRIVYDGDCPFCSNYVQLLRLRKHFDVDLIDAREDTATANAYGLDLNEGMIADLDGAVHHGSDAVWILSQLSERPGLFSNRAVARFAYPFMRTGRNLTLRMLGRQPI